MTKVDRRGPRLLVRGASEIAVPQRNGRGIDRLPRHGFAIDDGHIVWIGLDTSTPKRFASLPVYDAKGAAVLPALVDAHTHLVFGGDRIEDFCRRAAGRGYAEIAAEGGGILTTVEATRAASFSDLLDRARALLHRRLEQGIATTEIKSGYGLSVAAELRMLEVIRALAQEGFDVEATLLAAHAVPKDRPRGAYIDKIVDTLIPEVARRGLARFADVFVETGAYTIEEARRVFEASRTYGLTPRIHADQISPGHGAELAAEVEASSADHLEYISDEGIRALARAGVVAVLLPGAMTYLGDHAIGLGRRLVDGGVTVAVATDANPGTSPTHNLPLMATLAVTQMGLTAEEAIRAVTLGAAEALLRKDIGTIEVGAKGRFIVLESRDVRGLVAAFGEPIVRSLVLAERSSPKSLSAD